MSAIVLVSLVNLSAPVAIWLIANQIQLLSLLLLTGAFLPPSVKEILVGGQFTSFWFAAIPVSNVPVINISVELFDIEQDNVNLELMGLNSGSSFVSNIMFLLSVVAIIALHLLTLLIPK